MLKETNLTIYAPRTDQIKIEHWLTNNPIAQFKRPPQLTLNFFWGGDTEVNVWYWGMEMTEKDLTAFVVAYLKAIRGNVS